MTRLKIDYTTVFNNDADESDPEDRWAWTGTHSGFVNDVRVCRNKAYDRSYDDYETDLDTPLYAVYATYTDGGTFGSDWYASVIGACSTEDEARALVQEAKDFEGYGQLSSGVYVNWTGYFASLEDVQYTRVI